MVHWLCYRIHLWLGVSVGLWFALAALSGAALLLKPAIEQIPAIGQPNEAPVRLSAVVATVHSQLLNARIRYVFPSRDRNSPWVVELSDGREVYIDPHRCIVVGQRQPADSFFGVLRHWHVEMFSGRAGSRAVGWLGLASVILCLTGLVVWFPRQAVRSMKLIFWDRPRGRSRAAHWHRVLGLAVLPFLLLLLVSGTALAWGDWFTKAAQLFQKKVPAEESIAVITNSTTAGDLDALLDIADRSLPGGRTTRVTLPSTPDAPLVVRKKMEDELHPNGMNFIQVNPDGTIKSRRLAKEQSWAVRLLDARYPFHIGLYGGNPTRVIHFLVGLAPFALAVTGLLLARRRIRARGSKPAGTAQIV